jgi:hypothetical protein
MLNVPVPVPEPPVDAYVVARDETHHYSIDDADAAHIERIVGVYLLDRNSVTHCAEITPSHYLIHLYDSVWTKDCDDDLRERLCEKYEMGGGEDVYVHCRELAAQLDAAKEAKARGDHKATRCYHHGEVSLDDSDREEQMEELREHFCGNHVL